MKKTEIKKAGFSPKIIAIVNGEKMENLTIGEIFCLKELLPKKRLPELWEVSKKTSSFDILLSILYNGNFSKKYYEELMAKAINTSERLDLIDKIPKYAKEIIEKIVSFEECVEAIVNIDTMENSKLSNLLLKKAASFNITMDDWTLLREKASESKTMKSILEEMVKLARKNNSFLDWLKVYSTSLDGSDIYHESKAAIYKINPTVEDWTDNLLNEDSNIIYLERWYRAYLLGMDLMKNQIVSFDFWRDINKELIEAITEEIPKINYLRTLPHLEIIEFWKDIISNFSFEFTLSKMKETAQTIDQKIYVYELLEIEGENKSLSLLKEISEL